MRASPFDYGLQREVEKTSCEVCGEYKHYHKRYCDECEQYKKLVDDSTKMRKRAKAFGKIL